VYASGQLPAAGLAGCLVLVPNGTWVVGDTFAGTVTLSATVPASASASFSNVPLGPAPSTGAFDLLLLDGACGAPSLTILSADAAGPEPGLDLSAQSIPAVRPSWLPLLALLLALAALPLLRRLN
jgi:hypothetical protein